MFNWDILCVLYLYCVYIENTNEAKSKTALCKRGVMTIKTKTVIARTMYDGLLLNQNGILLRIYQIPVCIL